MLIKIGTRFRKDLGDIGSLAKSIADVGLLHPIVVSHDGTLIAGYRRLLAWRMLGRPDPEIPVTVVPLEEIAKGAFAENTFRKDFTPSEAWAICQAIKPLEEAAAKERRGSRTDLQPGAKLAPGDKGKSRDKTAQYTGYGRTTLARIGEIVQTAQTHKEFRPLVEEMDRTGRVNTAYRKYIQLSESQRWLEEERQRQQREMGTGPVWSSSRILYQQDGVTLICGDCRRMEEMEEETVDLVVTDPPFNVSFSTYGGLVKDSLMPGEYAAWTREWVVECLRVLRPGGQLYALMPIKSMPWWLGEIRDLWDEHRGHILTWCRTMANLHREKTYIRSWEPVLWLTKGGKPNVLRRTYRYEDDKDWLIGASAIGEVQAQPLRKGHPTPRPAWLVAYFLVRASEPGMVVLDPMVGSGTTAWVSRRLGRKCCGYDINASYLRLASRWIAKQVSDAGEIHEGPSSFRQAELIERWEAEESRRVRGLHASRCGNQRGGGIPLRAGVLFQETGS